MFIQKKEVDMYNIYVNKGRGYELIDITDSIKEATEYTTIKNPDYDRCLIIEHNQRLDMDSVIGLWFFNENRMIKKRNKNDKNRRK